MTRASLLRLLRPPLAVLLLAGATGCDRGDADCGEGLTVCNDVCADLSLDPTNCGACGSPCAAGFVCTDGECSCTEGEVACDGLCRRLTSDLANCGSCGAACPAGSLCTEGSCGCQGEELACGGACVDAASDPANCGACDTACPTGASCVASACGCAATGQALCGGTCVDTASDPANCGGCGVACSVGATCAAGSCVCAGGLGRCGDACIDLTSDPTNCGSCGVVCEAAAPFCVPDAAGAGHCSDVCDPAAGRRLCGADCVDLQSSNDHCGACDAACTVAGTSCTTGECACLTGALCDGACVDTTTSSEHCGACANSCGVGRQCEESLCACITGELCGESCVDTTSDGANCGGCNQPCGAGQGCTGSVCSCLAGELCEGVCVDTVTDEANCGGCATACGAGQQCLGGTCARGDLYAACFQGGTVEPFLKASHTLTGPAVSGVDGPQALALYGADHLLVVGSLDDTLYVVDRATMLTAGTALLPSSSCANQLTVRGNRAYVVKSCTQSVQVIDLTDPAAPVTVDEVELPAGSYPQAGAFDAAGTLWVSLLSTNEVVAIDFSGALGVEGTPIALPPPGGANANPTGVAVVGGTVYLAQSNLDASWAPAGPGKVATVDLATGLASPTLIDLGVACENAGHVAVSGTDVYVACGGNFGGNGAVVALDTTTGTVTRTVATGGAPGRVSVDPSRPGFFYASDSISTSLIAVDAADVVTQVAACTAGQFEFVSDVLVAP